MTCFAEALLWLFLFLEFCQQKNVVALVMRFCELWLLDAFLGWEREGRRSGVSFSKVGRGGEGEGEEAARVT